MNFKTWIKYAAIISLVFMISAFVWISREGKRMYGGLTYRVDHQKFKPLEGKFVIKDVNVLSPDGDSFLSQQSVFIDRGLITSVDSLFRPTPGATIIDGSGKYLIPGLIDSHVHLFQSPNDLLLYMANGVTQIQELIGDENHLEWRQQITRGRVGPKMFVASPRLGTFGTVEGWFMSWSQGYMNVRNAEEARQTVKELYDKGYDGIKIYSQLNKESYLAITETASSLGMPVLGHIPWELELSDIWENGQSSVAHFEELMNALSREFSNRRKIGSFYSKEEDFLDFVDERSSDLANNLVKNKIAVTSTLWLTESFAKQPFDLEQVLSEVELEYENPGISEWVSYIPQGLGWLPAVNRYKLPKNQTDKDKEESKEYWSTYAKACQMLATNLSRGGVKIMAGTDANLPPAVPGFSLHDELRSLNHAGMSPAEVLRSATSIPSEWLNRNSGRIAPGFEADLVLLEKNPLEDISNTKAINTVISKGNILDRKLLNQMLDAVKEANDLSREVNIESYIK